MRVQGPMSNEIEQSYWLKAIKLFSDQILTHCSFASEAQKTFVALHLVFPMPQKWRFSV